MHVQLPVTPLDSERQRPRQGPPPQLSFQIDLTFSCTDCSSNLQENFPIPCLKISRMRRIQGFFTPRLLKKIIRHLRSGKASRVIKHVAVRLQSKCVIKAAMQTRKRMNWLEVAGAGSPNSTYTAITAERKVCVYACVCFQQVNGCTEATL